MQIYLPTSYRGSLLHGGSEHQPADAAEAIDAYFPSGHGSGSGSGAGAGVDGVQGCAGVRGLRWSSADVESCPLSDFQQTQELTREYKYK